MGSNRKKLTDGDREAIRRAIEALPGFFHHIITEPDGRVLAAVTTGDDSGSYTWGPTLEVEQNEKGEWIVRKDKEPGRWVL